MRKLLLVLVFVVATFGLIKSNFGLTQKVPAMPEAPPAPQETDLHKEISDVIENGQSLYDVFLKHNLSIEELYSIVDASDDVYKLKKVRVGQNYSIVVDNDNNVRSFTYCIDDDTKLNVKRCETGFEAEKLVTEYERRLIDMGGTVHGSLVNSMDDLLLALNLSDIFAWDIDFNTDLREGDTYRIVVEGLYNNGELRKYGEIISAEFVNNGETFRAYRFESDGEAGYFDDEGKAMERAFLKAPLSFRRISSGYTNKRYHPVLKTYRPHLGVDYAAPSGTPVSAPASGTVTSVGRKGQNGKQIVIKHSNGYVTYYGHLSGYAKGIASGKKVKQGQIIGYVGSTGLATGPHLDYRIKLNGKFINPLTLKAPRLKSIPKSLMAGFEKVRQEMKGRLAMIGTGSEGAVADKRG